MDTGSEQESQKAIRALVVSLTAALVLPDGSAQAQAVFRAASASDPDLFFQVAFRFLESLAASHERGKAYNGVLGCPIFLIELTRKERFSLSKLVQICRNFAAIDKRLDIRLAHLLPGRSEDRFNLDSETIARILEVLNEVSVGPRLILLLGHLTSDAHPRVAERATVLMGRRVCNSGWSQRRLDSGGPEVRAGVVEGLWGRDTSEARGTMRKCLRDASERVVGNAVFGLHLLQEADVPELVESLIEDERPPFRATAAWLAGQIGEPQYTALLMRAKDDGEASVRLAAKQAMVKLRQEARLAEEAQKDQIADAPPEALATIQEPPAETAASDEAGEKRAERLLEIHLDGSSASTRWDRGRP